MRCPVPPRIPDRRGEEPFPLKHTTPRFLPFFFFFSLFLSHFYFPFIFLGMEGRSGEIRALPYTGGWLPHGNVIKPPFFPLGYLCISRVGWGYGYQKLSWPGPQGPQPVGSKVQRSFVVVCFLGSSPVRGSGISQDSGEVVASCWGFASPWLPSPLS